jgi:hypothetical protein
MAITSALLLTATTATPHVAFSCDTQQELAGNNVFSAASIGRAGPPGCAVCPNANVSSCWTSPESVWSQLKALPAGRRAISLEGFSPYYCEMPGPGKTWWWQDKLADGSASPWGDVWAAEVKRRFNEWFAKYASIGGQVDQILSDFEMGGHAYWYDFAHQGGRPQDALQEDSRWPPLRHRLNLAGAAWNASFDDLSDMQQWTVHDARAGVWDHVIVDGLVAEYLNASVYQPIATRFPSVSFSNFAHGHHTDPTGVSGPPPPAGDFGWPFASTGARTPLGTGAHVGTHQTASIYGKPNTTVLFARSTEDRVRTTAASPFDALVWNAAMMRDQRAAAPHTPVQPWIAPKYGSWNSDGQPSVWSWLSSSNGLDSRGDTWQASQAKPHARKQARKHASTHARPSVPSPFPLPPPPPRPPALLMCASRPPPCSLRQENVVHAALATGATTFLWWKPGANRPYNLGMPLLSSVLDELDAAVITAGGQTPSGNCTNGEPIVDETTTIHAADAPYLLSGTRVICPGVQGVPAQKRIYRLTPRCLDGYACAERPKSLLRPKTPAVLKLYSGFTVTPVPDGCWWAPANNASAAGFWIVAPC